MQEIASKIPKRIAFYLRVSTDGQEKAETIDNQLRELYQVYEKRCLKYTKTILAPERIQIGQR